MARRSFDGQKISTAHTQHPHSRVQGAGGGSRFARGPHPGELAKHFGLHPNQITEWKRQLLENAADAFGSDAQPSPSVDLSPLHAKIGQLTLENNFLEGALTKTGLLSAQR